MSEMQTSPGRSGSRRRARRAVAALVAPLVLAGGLVALAAPAAAAPETYTVPDSRVFTVDGRGFGHGRGMSQWGAQGGAVLGRTATQILNAYYPGTSMPAWREDPSRPLRVVLTGTGVEGRQPAGAPLTDRRFECDSTGAAACVLEVLPAPGLGVRDAGGAPGALPTSVAVPGGAADVARWRVVNDAAGLQLQALAGGQWQHQRTTGGPLVFTGPPTLSMRYANGTVREYRGELSAVRTTATTMARVNLVPREEYLRSVVPKEASPSWLPAALQAQAVAARTYADNYRLSRPAGAVWDICDSTSCQVYAGRTVAAPTGSPVLQEAASTDAAIAATRDLVRTFGGVAVRAEFSASNGGWSASGGTSWLPARQDDWDGVSPANTSHRWTTTLPASALEARFPVGRLQAVVVHGRDGNGEWGGRVGDVELRGVSTTGAPTSVRTTGEAVRLAHPFAGGTSAGLRSSWWKIRPLPSGEVGGAWSTAPGVVELSWRRADGAVGTGTWTAAAGMSSELSLGGGAVGGPALAGRRSGPLEAVVRGTDNQLWSATRTGSTWSSWRPLGGVLTGRPAVTRFQDEEAHVFVRGSDGALWHRWSVAAGRWSAWERLGGALAEGTGPAAVSTAPGRLEVVVHGTDDQAWRRTYAGGWSGWSPLGGRLQGDPSVASAAGELSVVVLGDGRQPYATTVDSRGAVAPWTPLGGALTSSPAAAAVGGGGRLDVFGTGTDGGFHLSTRTAAGWSGWRRIA